VSGRLPYPAAPAGQRLGTPGPGNGQSASPATRRIDEITKGPRFRKELGDIASLAESIEEHGLLQPIVLTPDGTLIAGLRRIEAFRCLAGLRYRSGSSTLPNLADGVPRSPRMWTACLSHQAISLPSTRR
jgi:hypothetical protein